jgi:hypothetical protein
MTRGAGVGQEWGAEQWGPVASWFAGALILAAVVVALRQAKIAQHESRRLYIARLIDHEASRSPLQTFYDRWVGVIQPPLFVALAILHGTDVYDAVSGINDGIAKMSNEETDGGFVDIRNAMFADALRRIGHRPVTTPLTDTSKDIIDRHNEHLQLLQQHFSLSREDVEKASARTGNARHDSLTPRPAQRRPTARRPVGAQPPGRGRPGRRRG